MSIFSWLYKEEDDSCFHIRQAKKLDHHHRGEGENSFSFKPCLEALCPYHEKPCYFCKEHPRKCPRCFPREMPRIMLFAGSAKEPPYWVDNIHQVSSKSARRGRPASTPQEPDGDQSDEVQSMRRKMTMHDSFDLGHEPKPTTPTKSSPSSEPTTTPFERSFKSPKEISPDRHDASSSEDETDEDDNSDSDSEVYGPDLSLSNTLSLALDEMNTDLSDEWISFDFVAEDEHIPGLEKEQRRRGRPRKRWCERPAHLGPVRNKAEASEVFAPVETEDRAGKTGENEESE